MGDWRADPGAIAAGVSALGIYLAGVRGYKRRRGRAWPIGRTLFFATGVACAMFALESPLDGAADARFAPHMLQHLILTDVTGPCVLLEAPLLLALGASSTAGGRRLVAMLRSAPVHAAANPAVTWTFFVVTMWAVHFSPFYEAALQHEWVHRLEHALYLTAAILFWLPVIAIGPTPWVDGPLAYPLRMLYLLVAMPALGFLGFSIYGARRILYPHYAAAGLADQQRAGEIQWIGNGFVMFVAFMLVGAAWARFEERRAARSL